MLCQEATVNSALQIGRRRLNRPQQLKMRNVFFFDFLNALFERTPLLFEQTLSRRGQNGPRFADESLRAVLGMHDRKCVGWGFSVQSRFDAR